MSIGRIHAVDLSSNSLFWLGVDMFRKLYITFFFIFHVEFDNDLTKFIIEGYSG